MCFSYLLQNTGTVVRGAKRAQFNVFMRPVPGITASQTLRTTLTPIFWIEEVNRTIRDTYTTHRYKFIRLLSLKARRSKWFQKKKCQKLSIY